VNDRRTDQRYPTPVFVKQTPRSVVARATLALAGLARSEVGFYRDLAGKVPVDVPTCYHASFDARHLSFLIVLEDLAASGAVFGRLGDALDRQRAEWVVVALADLHAGYWNDPRLGAGWPWLRPLVDGFEAGVGRAVAPALTRRGVRIAGASIPPELRLPMLRFARRRTVITRALDRGPRTLLHNDCHPGNLAFGDGGRVWLVDWQLVRAGPWARDVAYFCATALDAHDRAAWERELLEQYLDRLGSNRVSAPSFDNAWREYRRHLVYAFEAMVVTLALGVMQPEARVRPVVARTAAAVVAHDAFRLL
jgi:hypothetical protein